MAATRRTSTGPIVRTASTSTGFYLPRSSSPSTAFAYSSSSFATRSSTLFTGGHHHHQQQHRSTSPNRVNMYGSSTPSASSSVRFSLDRPTSPNGGSISAVNNGPRGQQVVRKPSAPKRTCMCSPTNHPGSFRCILHKNNSQTQSVSSPNTRLNARRSAMTNSIVRICGVEGDLVKRALSALIRPSSHQQKRRASFRPRASRLSVMSNSSCES